ncbi:MAG: aldo/keto reductase family protein [Capsulimonadales bacterium]|nr:aldo/keto reductase family protein [Capsulimonadales bacterium]
MKYRKLGKFGVRVSEVSLGSWLTYGGASADETARACIERAYDLGVNLFDTANAYAGGRSEEIVGKSLSAYPRSSFVLATKVYFPMGSGPNDRGLSRKHIFEQCHASLKRLGTEYIDIYQAHRYDNDTPVEETLMAFDDLVRQGKILYYGVSEWSAAQLNEADKFVSEYDLHPIASNQPQYNALHRNIEKEVLPTCARLGIGLIVYSPLAQGLLTGKYKPGMPLPEGSRASDPDQNTWMNRGKLDENLLEKVQRLFPIAQRNGITLSQMALAWCLRRPEVSSVIIGASRPDQINDNVAASGVTLSEADHAEIKAVLA